MILRGLSLATFACIALAPAPSSAEGEHRASLKNAFIERYQERLQESGQPPFAPDQIDRFGECVVAHAMRDVTVDEEERLDSWAAGGPKPDKALLDRIERGLIEGGFLGVCSPL
jgi:acetyl esterase/lipase